MKRYIKCYVNYFTIGEWANDPYQVTDDTDYVVLEDFDANVIWEGDAWDIPEMYYPMEIAEEYYEDGGLCIITINPLSLKRYNIV